MPKDTKSQQPSDQPKVRQSGGQPKIQTKGLEGQPPDTYEFPKPAPKNPPKPKDD